MSRQGHFKIDTSGSKCNYLNLRTEQLLPKVPDVAFGKDFFFVDLSELPFEVVKLCIKHFYIQEAFKHLLCRCVLL